MVQRLWLLFRRRKYKRSALYKAANDALNCVFGAEGARIGADLCHDDVGFNKTVKRLHQKFGNRRSQFYNRTIFFQRGQLDTVNILGYVTKLRQLVVRCGFSGVKMS